MGVFAALDVAQETTAVCVVDASGAILAEAKVATCPEVIAQWLGQWSGAFERIGMETGPVAVWLWHAFAVKGLPIVVLDARHASAALKMMPNKTDRHDARGLAQILRTGWYKEVRIKSHAAYVIRALLTARDALVGIRVRLETEIRGLLEPRPRMCLASDRRNDGRNTLLAMLGRKPARPPDLFEPEDLLKETHHGVSAKHLPQYVDEFVFRFTRRRTPMAAFPSLLGLTTQHAPTSYKMTLYGAELNG